MKTTERKLSEIAKLSGLLAIDLKRIEKMDTLTAEERFDLMVKYVNLCHKELAVTCLDEEFIENDDEQTEK